jgi:hypothetical protein
MTGTGIEIAISGHGTNKPVCLRLAILSTWREKPDRETRPGPDWQLPDLSILSEYFTGNAASPFSSRFQTVDAIVNEIWSVELNQSRCRTLNEY